MAIASDVLVSFTFKSCSRDWAVKVLLFLLPPIENRSKNTLPAVFQYYDVEIEDIIQLRVEGHIIRSYRAIRFVSNPCFDVVNRFSGIPLKITITLPRVTMLKILGLALSAETGAEQVPIVKLLGGVMCLTLPMLDLHCGWPVMDPTHTVAAKASLFPHQRTS